jgi:hypothetical protein
MKQFFKSSVCAAALFSFGHAYATEWERIIDKPSDMIFVDLDSYSSKNGYPSMLIKTVSKSAVHHLNKNSLKPETKIYRAQFDCAQHLVKKMEANKNVLAPVEYSSNQFKPVLPQSLDQEIESLVCQVHKMVGGL